MAECAYCHKPVLGPRQLEVLRLIVEGASNELIAYRLSVSPQTVKNHVSAILETLSVTNRTQAAVMALRQGLVD